MLKKILIALASLMALVLVVGLALPSRLHVERSITVRAPPDAVYARVSDLARWREWTPWGTDGTRDTQWVLGGPPQGVGSVRSWKGPQGEGTLSLTQADPRTGVTYDASVKGGPLMHGRITFTAVEGGTRVSWTEVAHVGASPVIHYLVPFIEARLGADFERSLERLQKQVEESPPPPVTPEPVPQAGVPAPVATPTPAPVETPHVGSPPAETAQAPGAAPTAAPSSAPASAPETSPVAVTPPSEGTPPPGANETAAPATAPPASGGEPAPVPAPTQKADASGEPAPSTSAPAVASPVPPT